MTRLDKFRKRYDKWTDSLRETFAPPIVGLTTHGGFFLAEESRFNGWRVVDTASSVFHLVHEFGVTVTVISPTAEVGATILAVVADEPGPGSLIGVGKNVIGNYTDPSTPEIAWAEFLSQAVNRAISLAWEDANLDLPEENITLTRVDSSRPHDVY